MVVLDTPWEFLETASMFSQARFSVRPWTGILLVILLLWPAAAQQQNAVDFLMRPNLSGSRGGNLTASISADPSTFNRIFARSVAEAIATEPLSADLFHVNRCTYELEPSLASGWEVAKDNRTYTIHLRRGLRFSDGSPFTAEDVVFTMTALQDPKNASGMADQLMVDNQFPSVAQLDPYTVRLTWPRPVGTGLRALDAIPMLPKSRLLKAYQNGTMAAAWGAAASPQDVVGLGPFRLRQYERGVRIVLERNPYYWKKDKNSQTLPYIDTLTFLVIPDRNAEAIRFQSGEIDVLNTMNPESYATLRRSERAKDYTLRDLGPGLGMDFLWFNLNPGKNAAGAPLLDPEKRAIFEQASFRQAISCALDRQAMAKSVWGGLGVPQYGPISSGNKLWFNSALKPAGYDPQRSKNLLAQAGLKDANGDGMLEYGARSRPFEVALLTARGNSARERTAEIISHNLAQVGIRVNVQLLLPNELGRRFMGTLEYEAILYGSTPSDIVPDLQSTEYYSSGSNHFWHPNQSKPATKWEEQMDHLTTALIQSLDDKVRKQSTNQIQEIWLREMPAIATVAQNILSGWSHAVGNTQPSILIPYLLWNVEELTKRSR
jgi:peptide/nickel transport system substrate-binding protein